MKKSIILTAFCIIALVVGCATHETHKCVVPQPANITLNAIDDCTMPAWFAVSDFNWRGSNLTCTIYSVDVYDAVAVREMKVGDTIALDTRRIAISEIQEDEGGLWITGTDLKGVGFGAYLAAQEGGTYRFVGDDDYPSFTELGKVTIPLADDFVIVDCGLEPLDSSDTIKTEQKKYLESLPEYRQIFTEYDTKIVVAEGKVVKIERIWILLF